VKKKLYIKKHSVNPTTQKKDFIICLDEYLKLYYKRRCSDGVCRNPF